MQPPSIENGLSHNTARQAQKNVTREIGLPLLRNFSHSETEKVSPNPTGWVLQVVLTFIMGTPVDNFEVEP